VEAERFLAVDGENNEARIVERWRALGIRNEHLSNVRLFGRDAGIQLGEDDSNLWFVDQVDEFQPDVVFLDTVAATTSVAVNDNDAVVALYRSTLVPLVERLDFALVFTHHERKSGGTGDRSHAALGARQWAAQTDTHLTACALGEVSRGTGQQRRRPQPKGISSSQAKDEVGCP
jgi:hypothetical protein